MRTFGKILTVLGIAAAGITVAAVLKKPSSVYDDEPSQKNPMEGHKVVFVDDPDDKPNADGVQGHLLSVGVTSPRPSFYERFIKRPADV